MHQVLCPPAQKARAAPWFVPGALDERVFNQIRRELVLRCCKWDPQVGDISTLAPFPIVLRRGVWRQLADWAESLATELEAAEAELLETPMLLRRLGLPRRIRRILRDANRGPITPAAGRIIRFDFHWTRQEWRISEANSDVPGGFTESSSFTAMMARHFSNAIPAGNPAMIWTDALARACEPGAAIALVAAPGYMEDQQIVAYLAGLLARRGLRPHICHPRQLRWVDGRPELVTDWHRGPVEAACCRNPPVDETGNILPLRASNSEMTVRIWLSRGV